jgi:hypothetical protein
VHEEPESLESSKEAETKEKKKNETRVNEDKAANKTEKVDKEKKSTIIQIKESINSKEIIIGPKILSDEKFMQSQEK